MKLAVTILLGLFAATAFAFFVRSSMPTGTSFAPKNVALTPLETSQLSPHEALVAVSLPAVQFSNGIDS